MKINKEISAAYNDTFPLKPVENVTYLKVVGTRISCKNKPGIYENLQRCSMAKKAAVFFSLQTFCVREIS